MNTYGGCTLIQWTIVLIMATSSCRAISSLQGEPPESPGGAAAWQIGQLHESPYFQYLMQEWRQNEMEKRAPSNANFFGVRGKKAPSNANFFGVRGKKDDTETLEELWGDEMDGVEKRAPAAGFFGMRGKKRPEGFFGMRGKKGPAMNNFFGVRGKKSGEESEEELDTLLRALLLRGRPDWQGDEEVVGPAFQQVGQNFDGAQVQKKAPSGFVGMRGKKDNGWETAKTPTSNSDIGGHQPPQHQND